jgi:molybdate transport system ATP-binding protein
MTSRVEMAENTRVGARAGEQGVATGAGLGPTGGTIDVRLRKRIVRQSHEHEAKDFVLDVEFRAVAGFTILFGASGAGKTTLLDCLAGLVTPDAGRIAIGARVLFDQAEQVDLPPAKRRIGYVFQDLALFPHMTVEQNVEYGLVSLSRSQRKGLASAILSTLRIDALAQRKPRQISGGERQRAALARTLVTNPEVLLLDEPLAALDARTKARILDDLRAWNHDHGIPILYVTHSREEVFALGERAIVLDSGRILAQGTPHDVLDAPRQEMIAQLAGFENIFDAIVESLHADRGTMTCRLGGRGTAVLLETPLVRSEVGSSIRVGIRAGDILLAIALPVGLSARNVIPGRIVELEQRDVIVSARVECGVEMEVHLTLAARDALEVQPGREVWLVIKTHSCHLMRG